MLGLFFIASEALLAMRLICNQDTVGSTPARSSGF
jgi:hypothetical protein